MRLIRSASGRFPGDVIPEVASRRRTSWGTWVCLAMALLGAGRPGGVAAGEVSFNREVRAVLSDHCFACHGPDEKTRKAGLRLDVEAEARKALKSGHRAIVPGSLSESTLVQRIRTNDADDRMPPAETKKPLSAAQIATLERWVAEGARYEGHWAYVKPARTEPPVVTNTAWVRNPVDRFVAARLEAEGLAPTPEASREKLLRRASLDLTGLPPTVEELDAFLADRDEKAYEKVVDRLLGSKHYGERMAQQWLDLARYGETQGYHHDRHRDLWRWRDWVIQAFNANQPFDEFTVDQLAGDLRENPTRDQLIATGFHRNEMTTSEGGALPEEYIVKYAVGRVDTTARVWLGTSMACAECHDHKYDPITQKDYYRFFAFFYDTPENGLDAEELNPVPRITLETPEQRQRAEQLDRDVALLETTEKLVLEASREPWDKAEAEWTERHSTGSLGGWSASRLVSARSLDAGKWQQADDGSIGSRPATNGAPGSVLELVLRSDAGMARGLKVEALPESGATGGVRAFRLARIETEARRVPGAAAESPLHGATLGPWSAVGPFAAKSGAEAHAKEFGPERGVDPKGRFDEGRLGWTVREGWQDGERFRAEGGSNAVTYATRTITVPRATLVEARVEAESGLRLWVNGRAVHVQDGGATPGVPRAVRFWLRPGENRVLAKVVNGDGDDGFSFRFAAEAPASAGVDWVAAVDDGHAEKGEARGLLDDKPETVWAAGGGASGGATAWLRAAEPFGFAGGTEVVVRLHFDGPGAWQRFRVSLSESESLTEFLEMPEGIRRSLARVAAGSGTAEDRLALRRHYREKHVPEAGQSRELLAARRKERDEARRSWPTAMVMRPASPTRETEIRVRGQYFNKGEKVTPGVAEALFPWNPALPANRMGLARWLMDPAHPLTARVVMNQYWQRLFGIGLVKSAEDFGAQGEWPSHPELLDWLATEFIRSGWDIKAMQKLLVTSATYRQDSVVTRDRLERDPENRLWSRGPRFRLDAENIRDLAMSTSGLLNPVVGGPSVFPYQPPGLWGQVSFEGTRDYVQSAGAENYRRGLYTYWRRSIPYASFTIFDAPSREVCVIRRPRTNTPLQALALLNDPVYVEAARALAQRVLAQGGREVAGRIDYAFRLVLGRKPDARERQVLTAACEREFRRFSKDRVAANLLIHVGTAQPPVDVDIAELAAWTVLANTLLNLDEAVTRG